MTKFLDAAGLTYFFTGLKKIFVRKVNGTAPDANGNVTINNMSAATSSAAGKAGLVPAPAAGAQAKYLRGDGTWQTPPNTTYSNMKGASTSAAGTAGLAPAPAAGAANRYLRSDGTWAVPPDNNTTYSNMTGATASAAGKAGLVPAPAAGKNNMPLCGDATFKTLPIAGGGTGLTAAPSMLTNLGSTTAASPLQASPRPGITGTLPLAHGGTGATTAAAAIKALIGSTAIGSTTKPIYYDGSKLAPCSDNVGGGVTLKIY